MDERDHFNFSIRSLLLHNVNLLLQLPIKDLTIDAEKFMNAFTATIDGEAGTTPEHWKYAPATVPLMAPTPADMNMPAAERRVPRTSEDLFPNRAEMLDEFFTKLHMPHASVIPDIAMKGEHLALPEKMGPKIENSDGQKGEFYTQHFPHLQKRSQMMFNQQHAKKLP